MKIKVTYKPYSEVLAMKQPAHKKPLLQGRFWRFIIDRFSAKELKETDFSYTMNGMLRLGKHEPALILMNHSSFIDLKIAANILYPRPFNIVCTSDGFVGKKWLMRQLGCIPTQKFITDVTLVRDMVYTLNKLKSSILMYPEASYSFDGRATPLLFPLLVLPLGHRCGSSE